MRRNQDQQELGVHMTVCPGCHKEGNEIILGHFNYKKMKTMDGSPVREGTRFLSNDLCDTCKKKLKEGGAWLIEAEIVRGKAVRTGNGMVMTKNAVEFFMPEAESIFDHRRIAYIEPETFKKISDFYEEAMKRNSEDAAQTK